MKVFDRSTNQIIERLYVTLPVTDELLNGLSVELLNLLLTTAVDREEYENANLIKTIITGKTECSQ